MIPGGGGGIGAIFGLDGRLRIVGCGMLTTAGAFEFEPLPIIVSLIVSIELEVTCSEIIVSGEIGKKFDADLNDTLCTSSQCKNLIDRTPKRGPKLWMYLHLLFLNQTT